MSFLKKIFRKADISSVRYIVCDIDGTLIGRSGALPQSTIEKILLLGKADIGFILATGRSDFAVADMLSELNISTPAISLDGALARQGDKIMYLAGIEKVLLKEILSEVEKRYNISLTAMTPKGNFFRGRNILPSYLIDNKIPEFEIEMREFYDLSEPVLRLYLNGDRANIDSLHLNLKQKKSLSSLHISIYESRQVSGVWFLEIKSFSATKGDAVVAVLKSLNIERKYVAGIGDYRNDVSMLKVCGYRVAMKEAVAELTEIADYVTKKTVDECGVEDFFRLVLDTKMQKV